MRAAAGEMLPDDKRLADEWHLIIPESDRNFLDSASVTRHFNQIHRSTTQRQSERINDEQNECVASFVNVPRINSKDSFSYRFFTARHVLLLVFRYFLFFSWLWLTLSFWAHANILLYCTVSSSHRPWKWTRLLMRLNVQKVVVGVWQLLCELYHHHRLFAQYAEMNSKICNVPDRKANSFSSNSQFIKQQTARRRPRQPPKYLVVKGTSMVQLITLISLLGLIVYRLQSRLLNVKKPS